MEFSSVRWKMMKEDPGVSSAHAWGSPHASPINIQGDSTSLNFVGRKVICVVCRSTSVATLTPTYHCQSPTGDKPYPLHRVNLLLSYISPSTWGSQRRARNHYHHLAHQANF